MDETVTYDSRGRVATSQTENEGIPAITGYVYDAQDRPIVMTLPNGEEIRPTYGDHGLPETLVSSTRGIIVAGASYNAPGKQTAVVIGNGLTVTRSYWVLDTGGVTSFGRLYRLEAMNGQTILQRLDHTYDPVGNLLSRADGRWSGESTQYEYDELDWLTRGWSGAPVPWGDFDETYTYNPIGNVEIRAGIGRTYPVAGQSRPRRRTVGCATCSATSTACRARSASMPAQLDREPH
jgi:YD repeat-containing protein